MTTNSTPAVTFDMPTLGRNPYLGLLYSAASAEFTGSYLFEDIDNENDQINIDVGRTDLKLTISDSFEDKSSVLDISASLSLEVLGGLVKVEGSGQYLTDSKANSEQHSWAMSLFLRTQEQRLLFEEKKVVDKRPHDIDDIIKRDQATHFVSSIVYGGSIIIELLSRRVELQKIESIKGNLSVQLEKLKGSIDLTGKAAVKIDGDLKSLNESFELKARGDFSAMPLTDLQSIVDSIPKAVEEIHDKPVPIMVTLQPIPGRNDPVYALEKVTVNETLGAFAKLDDVRARFNAVNDSARQTAHKVIIPALVKSIYAALDDFSNKSVVYTWKLADYLKAYYAGENPPTKDRTDLVNGVLKLVEDQLKSVELLEQAYRDFEDIEDIAKLTGFQNLTSFDDLADFIRECKVGDQFALFLVPPPVHPIEMDALSYIASLFRMGWNIFNDAKLKQFVCYVEDNNARQKLQNVLINDDLFDTFDSTIAIRVERLRTDVSFEKQQFDDLNTTLPSPLIVFEPNLDMSSGKMTYPIKAFDYESSFTIIIDASYSYSAGIMQIVEISDINRQGYHFVICKDGSKDGVFGMQFKGSPQSDPTIIFKSKEYRYNPLLVFVQDATGNGTWSFYIDGVQEGGPVPKKPYQGQVNKEFFITRNRFPPHGDNFSMGKLNRICILRRALAKEEIEKLPRINSSPLNMIPERYSNEDASMIVGDGGETL